MSFFLSSHLAIASKRGSFSYSNKLLAQRVCRIFMIWPFFLIFMYSRCVLTVVDEKLENVAKLGKIKLDNAITII